MGNQLAQAIIEAVKQTPKVVEVKPKSAAERVFLYVKENPGKTKQQIVERLKMPEGSADMTSLVANGLLRFEERPNNKGHKFGRTTVRHYFARAQVFSSEGLYPPKQKRTVLASAPPAPIQIHLKTPEPAPQMNALTPIPAPAKEAVPFDLDELTLGRARQLYAQLREIFGDKLK